MDFYDNIKALCTQRGITIASLERDLDFANGSFHKNRISGSLPSASRAQKIADYFGVPVEYILTGEMPDESYYVNPEARQIVQDLYDNPGMRILFDASRDLSPEDLEYVTSLVKRLKRESHSND